MIGKATLIHTSFVNADPVKARCDYLRYYLPSIVEPTSRQPDPAPSNPPHPPTNHKRAVDCPNPENPCTPAISLARGLPGAG
jgi:hypothetical protein